MDFLDWISRNFGKLWIAGAVISLAVMAVIIWAIITITLHIAAS
jgi:hypothetical protein